MTFLMILLAKYLYIVIIAIAVLYLLFQQRPVQKKILLLTVICLPLIYLVAKVAGYLYFDPRPFVVHHVMPLIPHAATNGFPSDHALISFAIAAVFFLFNKKLGIALGVLSLLVGISRIYVLVHSPIDILGSFVISVAVVTLIVLLTKKVFRLGI